MTNANRSFYRKIIRKINLSNEIEKRFLFYVLDCNTDIEDFFNFLSKERVQYLLSLLKNKHICFKVDFVLKKCLS